MQTLCIAVDPTTVLSVVDENAIVVVRIEPMLFHQLPEADKANLRLAGSMFPVYTQQAINRMLEMKDVPEVFLLFSASGTSQVPFTQDPIFVISTAATNAVALGDSTNDASQTKRIGSAIIAGNLARLNVDLVGKPSNAREGFKQAFSALGPAPLQFAVYLNQDRRRAIKEFGLKDLDRYFPMDSNRLAKVDWVAGSAFPAGNAGMELVFHKSDDTDARSTLTAIQKNIQSRLPGPLQIADAHFADDRTLRIQLSPGAGSEQLASWSQDAKRTIAHARLRRIALGLHNYHSAYSRLPSPVITDGTGAPLLSWRVALLPFLGNDEQELYQQFRMDEPWDSDHNRPLADQMPAVFAIDASAEVSNRSTVVIPVGGGLFFDGEEPKFRDVIDGISNTIMVFETSEENADIWTKPANPTPSPTNLLQILGGHFGDEAVVVHGDGSIHWINPETLGKSLWVRFTRNGKEPYE